MRILALLFDLESEPPASRQLIAWIDEQGNGKHVPALPVENACTNPNFDHYNPGLAGRVVSSKGTGG